MKMLLMIALSFALSSSALAGGTPITVSDRLNSRGEPSNLTFTDAPVTSLTLKGTQVIMTLENLQEIIELQNPTEAKEVFDILNSGKRINLFFTRSLYDVQNRSGETPGVNLSYDIDNIYVYDFETHESTRLGKLLCEYKGIYICF